MRVIMLVFAGAEGGPPYDAGGTCRGVVGKKSVRGVRGWAGPPYDAGGTGRGALGKSTTLLGAAVAGVGCFEGAAT